MGGEAGARTGEEMNQKDIFDLGKNYRTKVFNLETAILSEADPEARAVAALNYLLLHDNLGHLCDFGHLQEARDILSSYKGENPEIKSMAPYYAPKPKPKPTQPVIPEDW